jgi:hypothetical protein
MFFSTKVVHEFGVPTHHKSCCNNSNIFTTCFFFNVLAFWMRSTGFLEKYTFDFLEKYEYFSWVILHFQ